MIFNNFESEQTNEQTKQTNKKPNITSRKLQTQDYIMFGFNSDIYFHTVV